MNRRAVSSNSMWSARSSVVRETRETSEMTTMPRMNNSGDGDAVGLLDDVGDQRVEQHQGQHGEADRGRPPAASDGGDGDRDGAGDHHRQDAGGVGAGLGVDVGLEDDGDDDADRRVDEDDRPDRAAPLRRHAVAGQVARHDVDQAGHRRGAGEPQDQDAADVVGGAEHLAERARAPGRPAPGRWPRRPSSNSSGGISTVVMKLVSEQVDAHDQRGSGEQLAGVPDPRGEPLLGGPAVGGDQRHHADAGLEPGQAEHQQREGDDRRADQVAEAAAAGGEARRSRPTGSPGVGEHVDQADGDDDRVEAAGRPRPAGWRRRPPR